MNCPALSRWIGCVLLVTGAYVILAGLLSPRDCVAPMITGVLIFAVGIAFLLAKPITAERFKSRLID